VSVSCFVFRCSGSHGASPPGGPSLRHKNTKHETDAEPALTRRHRLPILPPTRRSGPS
jgi:hypothetical protein